MEHEAPPKTVEVNAESQASAALAAKKDFLTVGIGASAGGIRPLKEFFAAMPADSGMAFVVILHLSPEHESQLPAVLQPNTAMPVIQVQATVKLEPNHVYVIPPTKYLAMVDGEIRLIEPETIRGKRVPIDLFFRTLADAHGKNGISIVLSGTGADGASGLKRVKEAGGLCIVQDPAEAEYDGMPRSAMATNLVDLILPVGEMPAKILAFKHSAEQIKLPDSEEEKPSPALGADALQDVLAIVKARTKHDFSNYKGPTMLRRIARRLLVHGLDDIPAYVRFLHEHTDEVQPLLSDLLISVTNFFRDKEAFAALERDVVPRLFKGKTANDSVRVWCVGCATGEEAYSIGMLLSEYAATLPDPPTIQIFASDIDENAIAAARECRYDDTIAVDVSPARLRQFFVKDGASYRVKKGLRELVLFAPHNILHDSPFSRQDLVTCRNLLIYLNRPTQEKVMEVFHFALRQDGYLFLGASELAETVPALFAPVDKKQRIYKSRRAATTYHGASVMPLADMEQPETSAGTSANRAQASSFNALHFKLIERFSPPSVLINENYDILHLGESAGRYLRFTGGEPTNNLGKVAHPALRPDLLAALFAAKQENGVTESRHLRINLDGAEHFVNLTVHPIAAPEAARGYFLVVFDEINDTSIPAEMLQKFISPDKGAEVVIHRLEEDLQFTRDRLRQTVEQYEVSVEELKASNEELQAINEELRSTTEELETSKEELQSVNEELTTVNFELKEKVDEISNSNLDLHNLITSTDVSTIFLDRELNIKRFTSPVQSLFNIIPSDVGRPLAHLTHRLAYENLAADAGEVLRTLHPFEREVQSADERWHIARIIPYRTANDRIDGVLLTFADITDRKQMATALQESDRRKDEFLATLAHELRNPLAPMLSGLEIMRQAESKEAGQQARSVIERQLKQIVRLVDDLLDISRITQGKIKLQIERVELADAINLALETNRPLLTAAGHKLQVALPTEPIYLEADAPRLAQIVINLLNNAVKYTEPNGKISLRVATENKQAELRVKDSGVGIPADMLPHIFDIFTQVERASGQMRGGLGIGLSLVKNLVEMHGGTIAAYSAGTGTGSEFVVRLPLAVDQIPLAKSPLTTAAQTSATPADGRHILVVDDNADAAEMLEVLLTLHGHKISVAYNGESAVKTAIEQQPEVVLLDIGLPDIDGYEVARRIREKLPQALLIALTGWGQDEDRRRSREAGFNHHLVKPVETKKLKQLLAKK